MLQTLIDGAMPHLIDILTTILAGLIGAVLLAVRQYLTAKVGATTTAALADMLHLALETGAQAAVAANPGAQPGDLIKGAIAHAEASIPGTLAKLAPSPDVLVGIARAKVAQAISWSKSAK